MPTRPAGPGTAQALLDAALELVTRGGVEALTMRRLAKAARLTPMAVYHHFRDKDALLDGVAAAGFARLAGSLATARDLARPPLDRIRLVLHRYVEFAEAAPVLFQLMTSRPRRGEAMFPEYFAPGRSGAFDLLRDAVVEGIRLGQLRADDPTETALSLWAQVHGLVVLRATGYFAGGVKFRRLVDGMLDRCFTGLATIHSTRRAGARR